MKNTGKTIFSITFISLFIKILSAIGILMATSYFGLKDKNFMVYTTTSSIPNIVFTCIGTTLTTIVIPIYSGLIAVDDKKGAKKFIDDILSFSLIILLIIVAVFYLIAPFYIKNFTDYYSDSEKYSYAIFAIRIFMPIMIFYGLRDIFSGLLNSNNKFHIVAMVSLPTSLIMITYMVFFAKYFGVTGLIFASVLGYSLQAFILMPSVLKTGYRYKFSLDYKSEEIKKTLKLFPTILLGVSAFQINMLYNQGLSTEFETEIIMRIVQEFILGPIIILVISINAIYYPRLSKQWANKDLESYKKSLTDVITTLVFLLIPATIGIIILKSNIITLSSKILNFSTNEAVLFSNILSLYSIAIVFIALKESLDKAFYSQQITAPSGIVGILMMFVNIAVSLFLKGKIGTYSMPIAYTISFIVGSLCLFVILRNKIGSLGSEISINMLKCFVSACIMGVVVFATMTILENIFINTSIFIELLKILLTVLIGIIVYFISTFIMKVNHSLIFIRKIFSILKK